MTYDSAYQDEFNIIKIILFFICRNNVLYYHDTTNQQINVLNTVEEDMSVFSETHIKNQDRLEIFIKSFAIPR